MTDVRDRQHLFILHKKAKKQGLDLTKYNQLKDQISLLELDLKRIKDPLRANLPRKSKEKPTTEDERIAAEEEVVDKSSEKENPTNLTKK